MSDTVCHRDRFSQSVRAVFFAQFFVFGARVPLEYREALEEQDI